MTDVLKCHSTIFSQQVTLLLIRRDGDTSTSSDVPRLNLKPRNLFLVIFNRMSSALHRHNELGVKQKTFWRNRRCQPLYEEHAEENWQLSNLKIGDPLGQGSFGTVFQIKTRDNATVAAIKCIKKNVLDGERELLRVKSEFSCWRALSGHPNVIRLIAFLETESHWCFVMEYIDLGSLSQVLRSNDIQLTRSQIRRIAAQLCHAVSTVHAAGYIHRDISCSNVMLTSRLDARLIDFGLSTKGHVGQNRCGSLAYMAPEVLRKRPGGCGSDWWSVGIVLFAMLMGKTPLAIHAYKKKIDLAVVSRDIRFALARATPIRISRRLKPEEKSLLIDILREDPNERLGARNNMDFDEIKRHEFFKNFDWKPLDCARATIVARLARKRLRANPVAPERRYLELE
ncbi:protein kinase C zeta type-like isoform X3 [Varroa jacobsoni]|uniref:protein kinase C zeta type-like isoform X3 n=1 Tax=Varroa jacobsoni TaxID=62625 RepID=UPI000BF7C752|nr:protein kinase C zeta type-like isoform X3 [Varroa jacobsoni]